MKFLLFLGTSRDSSPPRPKRLGARVAKACINHLENHANDESEKAIKVAEKATKTAEKAHEVELVDVLDYSLNEVFKPHFAYAKGRAPIELDALADKISNADGYIMVSPEYNHSMSPALANLLNHFGSSLFSYKPSIIVTYSAGQWGGARAAVNMRTYLAELGCLPVSAMIHIPKAQQVFDSEGGLQEGQDEKEWGSYLDRSFSQLIWWGEACKAQRDKVQLDDLFNREPAQRNAPAG